MTDYIDSLCNCGKTIRYSHPNNQYSCNKYQVCPSHEELIKLYDRARSVGLRYEHVLDQIVKGEGEGDDCDFEAEVGGFIIWLILFGILFYNWN